jgi:hypothetical protein
MKYLLTALALLTSCVLTSAQVPPKPSNESIARASHPYQKLVDRAKRGDVTVDFKELRRAFADWQCEKNTDAPNREVMVDAFNKKDYAKAVELVEVVLDYEYIHRGLHLAAEDAYRHLGDAKRAEEHKAIADKLLDALLTSGDGKTAKTAFYVLSVREEYFVMQKLGYRPHGQALVSEGDGMFDVLMGTDTSTQKEVSLYFEITSFYGGCERKSRSKP